MSRLERIAWMLDEFLMLAICLAVDAGLLLVIFAELAGFRPMP